METEQKKTPSPGPAPAGPHPGLQHESGTAGPRWLCPEIESKDLGLKVLVQPEETEEIDVDIVAVHGLAVHPVQTWLHSKTGVNWLSDKTMLPAALPKTRIMAFGYKSYWYGDDAVRQSVDAVSGQLLTALDDKRRECRYRPIIFIGHCFGGLVIQRAYERATRCEDLYPGTAGSVTGIVFLGTPHRGVASNSSLQTQGQIYQAIARAKLHIQDNVLHTMAQDNELLVQTVHDFTYLVSRPGEVKPALFCFFEQKACKVGLIAGIQDMPKEFIVGQSSATFDFCPKEGLALDHFGLNKFEHAEDGSYDQVRRQLVKMAENSMDARGREKTSSHTNLSRALSTQRHHHSSLPVPIEREAHFAKRGDILELLEARFQQTVLIALSGGIGNGKTHVAVEYAHRFYREYPGSLVHWVDAGSADQSELSFKRIAETLHLRSPGTPMRAGQEVIKEVYHALKRDINSHWLLVLDGLGDELTLQEASGPDDDRMTMLLDSIPKPPLARILVTTRSKAVAMRLVNQKDEYVVDIPPLKDDDATLVLLGKVTSDAAKVKRAASVSRMLGGSAGALTFAHNYRRVVDKHCSWRQYMEKVQQLPPSTAETEPPAVVMRAWQLLYEPLREKYPETASLLRSIGVLDVQSIPRGFFSKSEFANHVRRLIRYGMVEPTADQRVLRVTAIVRCCLHAFLKDTGEQGLYLVEQEKVLSLMCDKFDGQDPDTAEPLLPLVLAVLKYQPTSREAKRLVTTLLSRIAHHYAHVGRPQTAMQHLQRRLDLLRQEGPKNGNQHLIQETERALEDARNQLTLQGPRKTAQAESETSSKVTVAALIGPGTERLGQELKQLEQSSGEDHADTIRKVSELAAAKLATHSHRSGSKDAAALYQRALAWCQKTYGDNNMDTARVQYNLALAHEERGEYDQAEALYHSASQTVKQHLGPGNPELLRILRSLALLQCRRRNLGEATRGLVAVLHGQDKALGYNHPDTLVTRQNMAMLLEEKGQVDAAGEELERVLGTQTYLLGRDDPAVLRTTCSLAMNYRLRGRPRDAETLFRATLRTQRKSLGKNHRDTATTDLMLRELLQSTERPDT